MKLRGMLKLAAVALLMLAGTAGCYSRTVYVEVDHTQDPKPEPEPQPRPEPEPQPDPR